MTENGPQTKVLQDEMELVREQIREDRHETNGRLTALETKVQFVVYIGGALFGGLISLVVLVTIGVLNP